jgi:hypothetical protein
MAFAFSRKRFRLFFAKGCLSISKNSNDEVEKMEFLIKGLNSYNSFLKRHIKLEINEINEINEIYSKITTLPTIEKIETVNKIIQSFESGGTLEPVRYLSSLKNSTTELFLVEEPLDKR